MNSFLLQKRKTDFHREVQEGSEPTLPQTARGRGSIASAVRRLRRVVTDVENYKLHGISIHNHYIYTQTSSKTHWFRVYERKPHQDSGTAHARRRTPALPSESGLRTTGLRLRQQHGHPGPGPTGPEGLICGLL